MCFPFVYSPEQSIIKPLQIRLDSRPGGSARPRDTLWGDKRDTTRCRHTAAAFRQHGARWGEHGRGAYGTCTWVPGRDSLEHVHTSASSNDVCVLSLALGIVSSAGRRDPSPCGDGPPRLPFKHSRAVPATQAPLDLCSHLVERHQHSTQHFRAPLRVEVVGEVLL